jgi:hypothetical protein
MKPTALTWIIAIFGIITFLPLMVAQIIMIAAPKSKMASDLIIGKGLSWRDQTHFRSALAFAWADYLLVLPTLIVSYIGVFGGHPWGYILWIALGMISVYFSILFWVLERSYTFAVNGWLVYYTYFWGFFLYWGVGALTYSFIILLRLL